MSDGAAGGPTAGSRGGTTVDAREVARFESLAQRWWDPRGSFAPLHRMNPVRLDYAARAIAAAHGRDLKERRPFEGLRLLDIGCGGGLLSEPMARLGAAVVGADAAERNVAVARLHAEGQGLAIDYRHATAEALAAAGERFDAVLNMEVIEHVSDPALYLRSCRELLRLGGVHVCSTLNRNPKSFAFAIVGAEWVARWLPRGTHDWRKFVTPDELWALLREAGLTPIDRTGMVYDFLRRSWSLSERDLSVNYVTTSLRPEEGA